MDFSFENNLSWQQQLAASFTKPKELLKFLDLDRSHYAENKLADIGFQFKVTRSFASRMISGDIHDPLLKQVLPLADELESFHGFSTNPVGDLEATVSPGILHKYHGRVLLILTAACAINCRYCFRREFSYRDGSFSPTNEQLGLEYISHNTEINEVILSGGDPLMLNDSKLRSLIEKIAAIPHIVRLRVHTRLPIVLPSRVTAELIKTLTETRLQMVVVLHTNHPNELDREIANAIGTVG